MMRLSPSQELRRQPCSQTNFPAEEFLCHDDSLCDNLVLKDRDIHLKIWSLFTLLPAHLCLSSLDIKTSIRRYTKIFTHIRLLHHSCVARLARHRPSLLANMINVVNRTRMYIEFS